MPDKCEHMQNFMEAELAPHNHLVNWSNTHECHPKRYYEPESVEELERIVAEAHEKGEILCFTPGAMLCVGVLQGFIVNLVAVAVRCDCLR